MNMSRCRRNAPHESSLDGQWRILFDPQNRGRSQNWQSLTAPPAEAEPIRVPSCWQEMRPQGYDGVAWLWRPFCLPAADRREAVYVEFDAVNYAAEVWVDNQWVGRHEGGYTPFRLNVSHALSAAEEGLLTVRVLHPRKDGRPLEGLALKELPCWREWESFTFGGIWQSVRLLNLPALHIWDCFVLPDKDLHGASIELTLAGKDIPPTVEAETRLFSEAAPDACLQTLTESVEIDAKTGKGRFHLPIDSPQPWSPQAPNLCRLAIRIASKQESGGAADEISTRFGMRWLTLENGKFRLNGKSIFLHGAFHEGLYPKGIPTPPSREFVEDELSKAKAAGFNLLRYWQIPIHPLILDVADEMGMMLCEEPPIEWILQTEKTAPLCEREIQEMILRDRNRPSVVIWSLLNEGGLLPFEPHENAPLLRALPDLCRLARSLDPTRLIIDHSGSWHAPARFYPPERSEGLAANDIHIYYPAPTPESMLRNLRRFGDRDDPAGRMVLSKGAPVYVSEFGYGGLPDFEKTIAKCELAGAAQAPDCRQHKALLDSLASEFQDKGLDRLFSCVSELCEATQQIQADGNGLQSVAIRSNPLAAGYVLHALCAGGVILGAEMLDAWRHEKRLAGAMAEAQRPRVLGVFFSDSCCVESGSPLKAEVLLVNDAEPLQNARLEVNIKGPDGTTSRALLSGLDAASGVASVWQGDLNIGEKPGAYEISFHLLDRRTSRAVGRRWAWTLPKAAARQPSRVAVIGDTSETAIAEALGRMGFEATEDWREANRVLVNMAPLKAGPRDLAKDQILSWAREGKQVLILAAEADQVASALAMLRLRGTCRRAVGNWAPCLHYFMDSALAEALPEDRLLGQAYANVLPRVCVIGEPFPFHERTISACFSYGGQGMAFPREFWWGSTAFDHNIGAGRATLCVFRLVENLAADPVARRLLLNLLARC